MKAFHDWLRELGLERYAPTFRDSDIDFSVVRQLTESDLRELGLSLGHRKLFLAAVANLDGPAAARGAYREELPTGAERRQLTVMFCDLIGSVALSEQLDPEELRALIQRFRATCAAVIERYEGHVARYVGDAILAYFGWPQAHEDDAERAVRTALELIEAVKAVPVVGAPLSVHIGIATGTVVVGQEAGEALEARLAVGATPNLAARLQSLAAADEILIAPATRRLLGQRFDLVDIGEQTFKGMHEPVRIFSVSGLTRIDGRFDASHSATALTPLIGRDEELSVLLARWRLATEAEGQLVLLGGEAGIGKSRLAHRLREQLGDAEHTVLYFQCSPYHAGSPLYPVIDQLERAAGLQRDDSVDQKLDRLERLLVQPLKDLRTSAHLFASLLSLPTERYPRLNVPPQALKERTLEALLDFIEALARHRTVLLIVEDAHWIDAATQAFLDLLVPRIQRMAVLMIVTYRPEYMPSWNGLGHVTAHSLNRLTRRQTIEMVVRIGGARDWPPELLDQIVANADGVPLFVEELSKAVLESGIIRIGNSQYELTGPLLPLAVPVTLKDSLTARLDRLGPFKEVAQVGACIGREFGYGLLAAVSNLSEQNLRHAIDELTQAQLIFRRGSGTHESFVFKHALVQDTAYQSLVAVSRQRVHQRIANALVTQFSDEATARPEIVAFHFSRANVGHAALDYWQRAGELAMSRSNYVEAITHFDAALRLLDGQPQDAERDRRELAIRVRLGPAYQAIKGMGSQEAGGNYERACAIGAGISQSAEVFQGVWGHWLFCNLTGRGLQARERAEQLVSLSKNLGDDEFVLQAHHARWTTFQNLGELATTRFDIEEGLRLYDRRRHGHHAHIYGGHDPGVCCRTQGAMCLWVSGYPDRANTLVEEGIALVREIDHPFSLAVGLWFGGAVKLFRGNAAECRVFALELQGLSERYGFKTTEPHALFQLGWALAADGQIETGLQRMEKGEDCLRALGQHGWRHICLSTIAEFHARMGQTARALECVDQAIDLAQRANIMSWRPEFLRQRAEWMLALGEIDRYEAKQRLLTALDLARQQTAHMLELRVATSLTRLLACGDESIWAAKSLAACLARFVEGADAPDVQLARNILAELRSA